MKGSGIDSQDVGDTGIKAINYLKEGMKFLPYVGDAVDAIDSLAEPVVTKVFGIKSNLLDSAAQREAGIDIFHDNDYLYNDDGTPMFPIEKQKAYKFINNWWAKWPQGKPDSRNGIKKPFGFWYPNNGHNDQFYDGELVAIAKAHQH